jgi:sugar-specific transcriptional regulator TrmB
MLKEFTEEIFTRYGLTKEDIEVYLVYLKVPRATVSEVYFSFDEEEDEIEYQKVIDITNKLVEKGFLKEVE